jgi:hypothetical protein
MTSLDQSEKRFLSPSEIEKESHLQKLLADLIMARLAHDQPQVESLQIEIQVLRNDPDIQAGIARQTAAVRNFDSSEFSAVFCLTGVISITLLIQLLRVVTIKKYANVSSTRGKNRHSRLHHGHHRAGEGGKT